MSTGDEMEHPCSRTPSLNRKSYGSLQKHLSQCHRNDEVKVSSKFLNKYNLNQCKVCQSFHKKYLKSMVPGNCQNCIRKTLKSKLNSTDSKDEKEKKHPKSIQPKYFNPFEFENNSIQSLYYLDDFNFQKVC